MLARFKRRSSLYTLPIVVLIGLTTVAALAAWQRSDIIAELVDQIAHGENSEATVAVRQLASISNPPLGVLVGAASSDERATAEAAQIAINRLLGQWKQQIESQQRIGRVAAQLTELAAQLSVQRRAFAQADHPWLASTTYSIVHLANQCPAKKTPLVAMHCDEILAAIEANDKDTITTHPSPAPREMRDSKDAAATESTDASESTQDRLERRFSEFPAPPVAPHASNGEPERAPAASAPQSPLNSGAISLPISPRPPQSNGADAAEPNDSQRTEANSDGDRPALGNTANRPAWSRPFFRVQPQQSAAPPSDSNAVRQPQPLVAEAANVAVSTILTRELLARWLAAVDGSNDVERLAVEKSLKARGFQPVPAKLTRFYLAREATERKNVLDFVIAEPTIDTRPWLLLLAEDEDADVRLSAVTMMATSTDPNLVDKALQISIRDRDPRIADLASRLRERRSQARRR